MDRHPARGRGSGERPDQRAVPAPHVWPLGPAKAQAVQVLATGRWVSPLPSGGILACVVLRLGDVSQRQPLVHPELQLLRYLYSFRLSVATPVFSSFSCRTQGQRSLVPLLREGLATAFCQMPELVSCDCREA